MAPETMGLVRWSCLLVLAGCSGAVPSQQQRPPPPRLAAPPLEVAVGVRRVHPVLTYRGGICLGTLRGTLVVTRADGQVDRWPFTAETGEERCIDCLPSSNPDTGDSCRNNCETQFFPELQLRDAGHGWMTLRLPPGEHALAVEALALDCAPGAAIPATPATVLVAPQGWMRVRDEPVD